MEARRGSYQAVRQRKVCLKSERLLCTEAGARCKPRLDDAVMPISGFHGVVIHQLSLR